MSRSNLCRASVFRCALAAAGLALLSGCYPSPPYENPLTPDQVRALSIKEVSFLPHPPGDSTAAEIDLYRRFALRSAVCGLGRHFDRVGGTAVLTFRLRELEVRREGGDVSVASRLSASLEGPGLKADYETGRYTDARKNVPNPPSVAKQGRSQAAGIVGQLLSMRGDGYPRATAEDLARPTSSCEARLYGDVAVQSGWGRK